MGYMNIIIIFCNLQVHSAHYAGPELSHGSELSLSHLRVKGHADDASFIEQSASDRLHAKTEPAALQLNNQK